MAGRTDPVFLVVVRDVVVGQDLAQIIVDDHPTARVIVVSSLGAAVPALAEVAAVEVAFVAAEPQVFATSPLAGDLVVRGGKVVLMGLWDDAAPPLASWKMLPFPFTTDDVRGVIAAR